MTVLHSALETDIEGRCVSLQKARRKRRHDYPDVVETERSVPYSLRKRRKNVAALKLPRPETEERGVSIQKARRKRTHDIDNLAIIHVSSCNDVLALQEMSLATFRIELGLHSMCMSQLHALYFMLRTSYSMCMYLLASQDVFIRSYIHLMSTTQLDRSRSPTMPLVLYAVYMPAADLARAYARGLVCVYART